MLPVAHAEVLARDWLPPVVLGRERAVAELLRRLDPPSPRAPPPWVVAAVGERGSGTSACARRAARELAERLRASGGPRAPRYLALRVAGARGTHGVASALLTALDEGFDGRGFPVAEILAGFLRRLRREGRPTVIVLDDLYSGGPELGPILRAFGEPDRFLPEGESGLPPLWTVLAGSPSALAQAERALSGRWRIAPFVALSPYTTQELRAIVDDRAERALGREPPVELVGRLVHRAVEEGGGAVRAIDLLRRALLGPSPTLRPRAPAGRRRLLSISIESSVVRAIEDAARGAEAVVGDVRRLEARYARALGLSPLPPTTLWRRIVRLEQAGYVRREVRTGGLGGTRSLVRVMTPIDEWVVSPNPRGIPRAGAPWDVPPVGGAPAPGPPLAAPTARDAEAG